MGPFEGGCHNFHHLHHSLVSGQIIVKEHSPAHQQKIGLNIYWEWPHPSEQDPVSPTVSLSHQEVSISFLSLSIREQTEWKPQSQKKLIKLFTWTTALSNSMKQWAVLCSATPNGQVMVESSGKRWSTGEGNDKPLQYSCLENPMNSMKRQKKYGTERWTPQVGRCPYATGEEWRNNSRKKRWSQSKNNVQL